MKISERLQNLFQKKEQHYLMTDGPKGWIPGEFESAPLTLQQLNSAILQSYEKMVQFIDTRYHLDNSGDSIYILPEKTKHIQEIPFSELVYCIHNHPEEIKNTNNIPQTIQTLIDKNQPAYNQYIEHDTLQNLILRHNLKGKTDKEAARFLYERYRSNGDYQYLSELVYHYRSPLIGNNNLRKHFSESFTQPVEKEYLSYLYVTYLIDYSAEQVKNAMRYFAGTRFFRQYDPTAVNPYDVENGHGYSYPFQNLSNPLQHISFYTILTPKEWHDIARINTQVIKLLPEEVRNNPEFWNLHTDFIGKGMYLNGESTHFDWQEVFKYLPTSHPQYEDIICDLLQKKAIDIYSLSNPTFQMGQAVPPEDYRGIPFDLRAESGFYNKALEAVRYDAKNIHCVPYFRVDAQLYREAIQSDYRMMKDYPEYVTGKMVDDWLDKTANLTSIPKNRLEESIQFNQKQGILSYIPMELRTKERCIRALSFGIYNMENVPSQYRQEIIRETRLPGKLIDTIPTPPLSAEQRTDLFMGRAITVETNSSSRHKKTITFRLESTQKYNIIKQEFIKHENTQKKFRQKQ